jgi:hypothetical protein
MQTEVMSTIGLAVQPRYVDRDPPGRIAIFRPLGLEGLTATPALRAVRTALPEAEVTYIGDENQPGGGDSQTTSTTSCSARLPRAAGRR